MKKDELESLTKAATTFGSGVRSPLYRWMDSNFLQFKTVINENKKPNWIEIAKFLSGIGLVDALGKEPSSKVSKQTWWKVKQSRATKKNPFIETVAPTVMPEYKVASNVSEEVNSDALARRINNAQKQIDRKIR